MKRIAAFIAACAVLAGCGGHKAPHPATTVANCHALSVQQHVLGACLPHTKTPHRPHFLAGTSIQGPDLSNNDPVYGNANWARIAARNKFAYLKSTEGTGYYDQTAASMAGSAKANHIPVGGYDFIHLCSASGASEANYFVDALNRQGLLGAGTLPPAADVEYGSSGCNTAAWMNDWVATVVRRTHEQPIVYTGAWFWNPNLGSYWPGGLLSWISGYGVSYPSLPSGLHHLDFWQWSDNAYNGVSSVDMSSWMHDAGSFNAFAQIGPPPDIYAVFSKTIFDLGHNIRASEYKVVTGWDKWQCTAPTDRAKHPQICGYLRYRLVLLRGRLWTVAHYSKPPNFNSFHRHQRFQDIQDRIQQTRGPWGHV